MPASRIRSKCGTRRASLPAAAMAWRSAASFVTESQFSREPNTSKIGFSVLNWHLAHWGFAFNDGKVMTPTCHDMGFRDIPRGDFLEAAGRGRTPKPAKSGRWQVEADVATVADWRPQ